MNYPFQYLQCRARGAVVKIILSISVLSIVTKFVREELKEGSGLSSFRGFCPFRMVRKHRKGSTGRNHGEDSVLQDSPLPAVTRFLQPGLLLSPTVYQLPTMPWQL